MKKKWYRNGMVKTVAAVVGIASLTAAAAGGTSAAGIMSMGVNPLDKGSYLESRSFERSMYDNTYKVLHALAYTQLFHSEQGGENIDLGEILQSRNPTEEKLTGLSYKLSDLKKWAEIDDWNTMTDDILICVKPDGSPEYMYYDEFEKKILDGELEFLAPSSNVVSYEEYEENAEYAEDYMPLEPEASGTEGVDELAKQGILACLKNHDYAAYEYYGEEQYYLDSNVGILNSGVLGVGDKDGEMVYRNVINEESDYQIAEAFPPAGADSILDILNEEPQWEGKLNQAFMALTDALDQIRVVKISEKMLKQNYVEGKTNLSYLLVTDPGKPGEKIMSNAEAGDYEKIIKEVEDGKDPYVILGTAPEDGRSNLTFAGDKTASGLQHLAEDLTGSMGLSLWQHMVENVGLNDQNKEFVFAAWVDKDFPVQDIMAEDAENYEKYSKWLMPSMILFAAGTLIFLICLIVLTAGAGRNNEEETVQLLSLIHI